MAKKTPDAPQIDDESQPGAEQRFLDNLKKDLPMRDLARMIAAGIDPGEAYDIVAKQHGSGPNA